jgi:hypothetical protein
VSFVLLTMGYNTRSDFRQYGGLGGGTMAR